MTIPLSLIDHLARRLADLAPGFPEARLCVAFSGGVDSVALLHAARELAAYAPELALRAVHVDHGLQPASGDWAGRCRNLCARLCVPLEVVGLRLAPRVGESVEAEARRERYAALAARLRPGECLLTAHHADDQLETVLLQLFRGAGVSGLAAMPVSAPLGQGLHLRPWLEVERDAIVAYASALGLNWIEDPMNREPRFDRAWLRHEVLPAVRARWPAVARTVGRSARHLAAARQLLETLAELDAASRVDGQGRLEVAGLLALPAERQANLLRWWIARRGIGMPSTARLAAVLGNVAPARADARPVVTWPGGEVRRYRGWLYAMPPLGPPPPADWQRPLAAGQTVELPGGLGSLSLEPATGEGIAIETLVAPLCVRFHAAQSAPGEALARVIRERRVVPWMRPRLPLVCGAAGVLAVPGVWQTVDTAAGPGRPGLVPRWRGGPPLT